VPVGSDPLTFVKASALVEGKPQWTFGNWVIEYTGTQWVIAETGTNSYEAVKTSAADTPIGLTGWTVGTGAGQPVVAARADSAGEIIGGNGLDLYGEDLPTMTGIIGVMIQCTSGALRVASTGGSEINEITAGETRMFVNPNGTGVEYDSFDVIAEANDTELEITIIGK
jgi:hypothetical protein